jgi:hypothetical protein
MASTDYELFRVLQKGGCCGEGLKSRLQRMRRFRNLLATVSKGGSPSSARDRRNSLRIVAGSTLVSHFAETRMTPTVGEPSHNRLGVCFGCCDVEKLDSCFFVEDAPMSVGIRDTFAGRFALAVASVAVLVLMATTPSDAMGPWPYAVGGGTVLDATNPLNENEFAFSALQGPSSCRGGFGSTGHGRFDIPEAIVLGPVSCVNVVSPNQAVFVVQNQRGTNTSGPSAVTSLRVYVQDNGNPTSGVPVDLIDWQVNPPAALAGTSQCDVFVPPNKLVDVVNNGNIVVRFVPGADRCS